MRGPGNQVLGVTSRLSCNLCCPLLWYFPGPELAQGWDLEAPTLHGMKWRWPFTCLRCPVPPDAWLQKNDEESCVFWKGRSSLRESRWSHLRKQWFTGLTWIWGSAPSLSRFVSLGPYMISLGFSFLIWSKRNIMDKEINLPMNSFWVFKYSCFYYCFFPFADHRRMRGL